ncbi:MAG: DUF4980 domain-containing protein [Paludibacteraceae bacterium]|nr:DUF4980 domain-containing protein [Paludibacteraceae bacterium]
MKQNLIKQLTIIVLTLLSVTVYALPKGITMNHSGEFNTLLTINPTERYLSLPIEEAAPEAFIRVIIDGVQVTTFNARLAADSIDYVVPFDMQPYMGKQIILDIHFPLYHYNKKHPYNKTAIRPDRRKFICWKEMQTSDRFVVHNREQWRSTYHHTPFYGWMNDPNGMFYDALSGLWHLYYQFNPYGSRWGNMNWGHSISADLRHWTEQDVAIAPDALGTIFSGSCVIDKRGDAGFGKNAIIAFYTGADQSQKQSMAYSVDGGKTFVKYDGNPVLTDTTPDFRDPKVIWNTKKGCWTMVLACQQEMRFYSSQDLKTWHYDSRFGEGYGNHSGVWECPDLFELTIEGTNEKKWVLLCNINPGGPFGGSATQYFVGDFDGTTFTCVDGKEEQKWLDYGKDHYATVTWHNAPQGRVVALGWMSNWQYANEVPTKQFRSQNTIARDLGLYRDDKGELRVAVRPSSESLAAKGKLTDKLNPTAVVEIEVPAAKKNTVITLSNDRGEQVTMTYNFKKQTFSMDRRKSGKTSFSKDFPAVTVVPLFVTRDTYRLTLFIDNCSVEAFDGNGAWSMTNLVFPNKPYNNISVSNGSYKIYEIR